MNIPFTIEQFFNVFEKYNTGVWPFQIILFILALFTLVLAFYRTTYGGKMSSLILSFFWLWMGIIYHLVYFTKINNAAYIFGTLFILQGIFFIYEGAVKNRLHFRFRSGIQGISGAVLITYALFIYPLIGLLAGQLFPSTPTFGLPCPTTIFTLGLLLWAQEPAAARYLFIIPLLWSAIGSNAALRLGVPEDYGLLIAGILGVVFLILQRSKNDNKSVKDTEENGQAFVKKK